VCRRGSGASLLMGGTLALVVRCWVSESTAAVPWPVVGGVGVSWCRSCWLGVWVLWVVGGWLLFEIWIVDASICGQVCKGARWMPWYQEPMKDVGGRDSPRGVVNRALIRGCPNGETRQSSWAVTCI
jgi:hypothetical protein